MFNVSCQNTYTKLFTSSVKKFKIPTNKYDNKISVALQYCSIKVYEYRQTKYTNKRLF